MNTRMIKVEDFLTIINPVQSKTIDHQIISGISIDSRTAQKGDVFFTMPSLNMLDYVNQAYEKGVRCFVISEESKDIINLLHSLECSFFIVSNIRKMCADVCQLFFKNKPEIIVYVTGTNGKSSTVSMLRQFWQSNHIEAASIGTLGVERAFGFDKSLNLPSLTSLDSVSFNKTLNFLAVDGVKAVACEASSHGVDQYRLDGPIIEAAAFLNFTQDHLDYHGTMENYFKAKSSLFKRILPSQKTAVLNSGLEKIDELKSIAREQNQKILTFGTSDTDDIKILKYTTKNGFFSLDLSIFKTEYKNISFPLFGIFQIENLLCAIALAYTTGVSIDNIVKTIPTLNSLKGRMEYIGQTKTNARVFIDFAHSPDALENILKGIKYHNPKSVHLVFGCGGDRDPLKRPIMGKIAHALADVVYITNDNPRHEDEKVIRNQILKEAPKAKEIADRREAIHQAISGLKEGDILIIAGKGHEEGQNIKGTIFPFSDQEIARECLC
ncbi:MAG: UDP-N-acetylmuramoyl-L-alanyl-D-glutamate--2,6-diaminopimelate ligase [Proteobacteria bacterium]|nr:UDP-N-acetylmuramoyl-L-alanyl-D-glutamate--2,6-diaminopimelate ligase [Pseudomonadota bacterium]